MASAMTLDARARRAPVRRREVERPAPRLRVLDDTATRARTRVRPRLYVAAATTLTFLCLFGVAAVQVLITQGQFELARLERSSAESQARYDRLRLEVAELESPAHVVATAQRRLGMVPPDTVTYLAPPSSPKATATVRPTAQAPASGPVAWQELKPHLSGR